MSQNHIVGYLLSSFHFTINVSGLHLDFLGFILIAAGLWQMADKSAYFKNAIPWAIGRIALSILPYIISLFALPFEGVIFNFVAWADIAITLYISYNIVAGVGDLQEQENLDLRYEKLNTVWTIHAVLTVVGSLLSYIHLDPIVAIAIPLVLIDTGIYIAFLVLLFKARTRYQSAPSYNA